MGAFRPPLRRLDETFCGEVGQSCVLADAIVVSVDSLTRIVLGVDKLGHCPMKTLPLKIIQLIGVFDRLPDLEAGAYQGISGMPCGKNLSPGPDQLMSDVDHKCQTMAKATLSGTCEPCATTTKNLSAPPAASRSRCLLHSDETRH